MTGSALLITFQPFLIIFFYYKQCVGINNYVVFSASQDVVVHPLPCQTLKVVNNCKVSLPCASPIRN